MIWELLTCCTCWDPVMFLMLLFEDSLAVLGHVIM